MKVAVRCIYHKAVTPSMDIVDMPSEVWSEFLYADARKRVEIVCTLLDKKNMETSIREIAWLPIDGQDKLQVK